MTSLSSLYTDRDLSLVVSILATAGQSKTSLARAFREDREIREAMLLDDRLFDRLMRDDESIISASPYLFFSVLVMRVRQDLERTSYTVEYTSRQPAAVFDTPLVRGLLADAQVRDYIVLLLASFVRVRTTTVQVPVRPGVWRRLRVSDYDVDSLVEYCHLQAEAERFDSYRRVGDVCLFLSGMFPGAGGGPRRSRLDGDQFISRPDVGRMFYRLAAAHETARAQRLEGVLNVLAQNFDLAAKPLSMLAGTYLVPFKGSLFREA